MNRQQIRNQQRLEAKKQNTYNYTPEQIDKMIREHNARTIKAIYSVVSIVLHDKFGWGQKRISKMLEESIKQFNCVTERHVTIEELNKICKTFGVEIK